MGSGHIRVDMIDLFIKRVVFVFNMFNLFDPISL